MAASFSLPTVLANLAAGNQPLALIDGDFTAIYNPLISLNTYSNYYTDVGAANAYVITVSSPQTVTQAAGLRVQFIATNVNTGASTFQINALAVKNIKNLNGSALVAGQIPANSIVDLAYDGTQYLLLSAFNGTGTQGSFTITLTGFTAGVTGTAVYSITNNVVTLFIPALTGTSNATTMTATGLPASITPATAHNGFAMAFIDNGATGSTPGRADISAASTILFYAAAWNNSSSWTNSGTKGLTSGATFTYNLN